MVNLYIGVDIRIKRYKQGKSKSVWVLLSTIRFQHYKCNDFTTSFVLRIFYKLSFYLSRTTAMSSYEPKAFGIYQLRFHLISENIPPPKAYVKWLPRTILLIDSYQYNYIVKGRKEKTSIITCMVLVCTADVKPQNVLWPK